MANSLNKVLLIGNMGGDPEIRTTQDGREIASFSLATSEAWKDKGTGEKREKTEWHRIVVFAQPLVNLIKNHARKGLKLYVEGALQTRKWTDQSGAEKYSTEVVLQSYSSTLLLLDSKRSGGDFSEKFSSPQSSSSRTQLSNDDDDIENDEIPF